MGALKYFLIFCLSIYATFASAQDLQYANLYAKLAYEFNEDSTLPKLIYEKVSVCKNKARDDRKIQCLKTILFKKQDIAFDSVVYTAKDIFPDKVWKSKKGFCLPISLIVLISAEYLGLKAQPIAMPGHVFVRFHIFAENKKESQFLNLEPNRRGYSYTDQEYSMKYQLDPKIQRVMQPLTIEEFKGMYYYEYAKILQRGKLFKNQALKYYEEAWKYWKDVRVGGSLAILYFELGNHKKAIYYVDWFWHKKLYSKELAYNRILIFLKSNLPRDLIKKEIEASIKLGLDSKELALLRKKVFNDYKWY